MGLTEDCIKWRRIIKMKHKSEENFREMKHRKKPGKRKKNLRMCNKSRNLIDEDSVIAVNRMVFQ